jgi:hypothetical protein
MTFFLTIALGRKSPDIFPFVSFQVLFVINENCSGVDETFI